jgi:hypothetical protein
VVPQLKNDLKQKAQQLETDRGRLASIAAEIAESRKGKEDSVIPLTKRAVIGFPVVGCFDVSKMDNASML